MIVKFKRMHTDAILPTRATKGAACFDCYLPKTERTICPGETRIVKLGFALQPPPGYKVEIYARSGLASRGLIVANGIGQCDEDFTHEYGVILMNLSPALFPLNAGDRICQLALHKVEPMELEVVDEIDCTDRQGGFGSTGGYSEPINVA